MNVDLSDLRINRKEEQSLPGRSGGPWPLLFFLLLIAAAALFWWRESSRPDTQRFPVTIEVVSGQGSRTSDRKGAFTAAGWVKLPNYYPVYVSPLAEGRLEELLVIEGDRVERGQIIARLYRKDYQAALDAAEGALKVASANHEKMSAGYRTQEIEEARSEVTLREAEEKKARQDLERSLRLQPQGAISLAELQRDEAVAATARAAVTKARERLGLLEEGFRAEEVQLAAAELEMAKAVRDLARLKLDQTEILAPQDGTVLERLASPGQWIKPGEGAVVSIYDPDDLEAQIDVSQDHIAKVRIGQTVEITTRAEPDRTQPATVVLIEPKADQVKNIVRVKAKFDLPGEGILYPDMVVQARFRKHSAEAADEPRESKAPLITIPASAVVADGDNRYVFVVIQGRARLQPVELGAIDKGRYTVLAGLRGGESVVTAGAAVLTEGAEVHASS